MIIEYRIFIFIVDKNWKLTAFVHNITFFLLKYASNSFLLFIFATEGGASDNKAYLL